MQYTLQTDRLTRFPNITLVGCGGTGAFVAEGICRLFTGRPVNLSLVDHDRIEPHNLLRQHFYPSEVGQFKSKALAERLAKQFDRPINYTTKPFTTRYSAYYSNHNELSPDLVVSCVDNAKAREDTHNSLNRCPAPWLIDAGNGYTWGQVLIGNTPDEDQLQGSFVNDVCTKLPAPATQRPALLTALPHTPPDIDCAAALDLTDQDPTINQAVATWIIHIVRRMAINQCPFMAIDIDLDLGSVVPIYATPENVAKALNIDPSVLTEQEHE